MPRNPRSAYKDIVKSHINGCEGTELSVRCELLVMRDQATIDLRTAGDTTGPLLYYIEQMATRYALEPMAVQGLILLGSQLRTINESASMLALLEGYRDE